ncbi:unnamed protein product [Brachionus calyciflorus]|uniref:NFX1-type zinc finger-containing protein 1 n=1 Tax=Brachionus calyciflorus TaxID=104777 RepID=A0A813VQB3_9BILA|nr:unnamed protein product [Brachionus calyciflorus]
MKNFKLNFSELNFKQSEEIALNLCQPRFNPDAYFEKNFTANEETTRHLANLFDKALQSYSMSECLTQTLLPKLIYSKFWREHVYDLLGAKFINYSDFLDFVKSIFSICHHILILNSSLLKSIDPILERLDILIKYRLNNSTLLDDYNQSLGKFLKKSSPKKFENDFTRLSVVPKIKDVLSNKTPKLNKNIINGSYNSVNDYLDTQFRLLREDFLQPLRLGIGKFQEIIRDANLRRNEKLNEHVRFKLSRIESLNVYFDVKMTNNMCTDHGVVYTMKLDWASRRRTNWETSKKLIFGSLVCLSSDYFNRECIIGTICNRDSDALINQGIIQIKFNYDVAEMLNSQFNLPSPTKQYTMLETTAFFESYKHVLHALISFGQSPESDFPFKEILIDAKNSKITRPDYLKNAMIDFRSLVDKNKVLKVDPRTGIGKYEFSEESSYARNCSISNPDGWPNAEQMGLDESQYEAIKLALENKLTLIQGPPGTGKTYIGVKLVELLVHNKNLWWQKPGDRRRPILMVCYTNHALDQFLEYCVNVCKLDKGVVRVGSRCKNENLNPFLLSKLKRNHRYDPEILQAIKQENNKLLSIQNKLESLNSLLNCLNDKLGIVSFDSLKEFMNESHLDQLMGYNQNLNSFENRSSGDYTLLEWLGVFDIDPDCVKLSDLASELEKLNVKEENPEENGGEQLQVFDFDNQYLNNERMLEDDFLLEILESKPKKRSNFFINYDEISDMAFYFNELNTIEQSSDNFQYLVKRRMKFKNLNSDILSVKEHFDNLHNFNKGRTNFHLDESYNIWRLNINERFALYLTWAEQLKLKKQAELEDLVKQFNQSSNMLQEIRMQKDKTIMENALIIAMTTTGSSRYHKILKDIGPRIVIVEEAAEVFEAHIVSSLSKHCEHLILIGDHAQLRPNPAVYSLAIDYNLDVSLFERLVNNDTKKVMLKTQHRMRPEISVLMKHFYEKKIENHSSVLDFESIRGIDKNIYFVNHQQLESRLADSLSKANRHEALYLTKLCIYLLKQNYLPSQITVLTMYLGQATELRNLFRANNLTEIKVSTVDNFQGEENDIILLSLVRSNSNGKIGFLNIHNRVCVALSRARKGFYCIGNLDFIASHSDKWSSIIEHLKNLDCVGQGLKLTCTTHPENDVLAIEPDDFDLRLDGGCKLKCNFSLKCGHECSRYCHGNTDQEHLLHQCNLPCEKINPKCGHKCTRSCSQTNECNSCRFKIDKYIPECGHEIKLYCNTEPMKAFCYIPCEFKLPCGHNCSKVCARHLNLGDHEYDCKTMLQVDSQCKHKTKIMIQCSEQKWVLEKKCDKQCGETLECGHVCTNLCGQCLNGRVHKNCDEIIERVMPCGHKSTIECWRRFEPCEKGCFYKCSHRFREISCHEPLMKCLKPCRNNCEHFICDKKCSDICDRPPCNEQCPKRLKCGHQCIGICGEPCPRLCRLCDRAKVTKIFFGNERNDKAKFVFLFDCRHLLESNGLDNWVNMAVKNNAIPVCPKCKTRIRSTLRYSNLIKKHLNHIEEMKEFEYGNYDENFEEQNNLRNKIENLSKADIGDFDLKFRVSFLDDLDKKRLTRNELVAYKHTFMLFVEYLEITSMDLKLSTSQKSHLDYETRKIEDYLLEKFPVRICLYFSEQGFKEILSEIKRVKLVFRFYSLKNKLNLSILSDDKNKIIGFLDNYLIESTNKIDDGKEYIINDYLEKLETLIESEYRISKKELDSDHSFKSEKIYNS